MHPRMRQHSLFAAVAIALAVALGATTFAQGVGTWKLNVTKSKFHQGQVPKTTTILYEPAGEGIKVTVDTVPATGAPIHYANTANYDGTDNPVVGKPNAEMASRTRVDATTTKLVNKKGGKTLSNVTIVTSSDGKTLTVTTAGTDAQGQNVDSVAVYEKQ
jgi:hypothetical protein